MTVEMKIPLKKEGRKWTFIEVRKLTKVTELVNGKDRTGSICHAHGAPIVLFLVYSTTEKVNTGKVFKKEGIQKHRLFMGIRV